VACELLRAGKPDEVILDAPVKTLLDFFAPAACRKLFCRRRANLNI
jgi:hypothetical protein